jgi:uncharacterized membrane protein
MNGPGGNLQKNEIQPSTVSIWLALILAAAILLRFIGLGANSLWSDELYSWWAGSFDSLGEVIAVGVVPDVHPPGFQIIVWLVEKTLGDIEWMLRLPSALAGILAVFMGFVVGRRLYGDREGLYLAALLAFLWFPVRYSQEARAYSLLLLMSLVTFYLWHALVIALESNRRLKPLAVMGLVVASAFTAYLHYFGLLLVFLQGSGALLLFVRRPRALLRVALIYGVTALLYTPWLPVMWQQLGGGPRWMTPQGPGFVKLLAWKWLDCCSAMVYAGLALCAWFYAHWCLNVLRGSRPKWRAFLLSSDSLITLWLVVPLVVTFAVSAAVTPLLSTRNLIISLPALYLVLARALAQIPLPNRGRDFLAIAVFLACLAQLLFGLGYYTAPQKCQFREAYAYVGKHVQPGAKAGIVVWDWFPQAQKYYLQRLGVQLPVLANAGRFEQAGQIVQMAKEKGLNQIWYVHGCRPPKETFLKELRDHWRLVDVGRFKEAAAYLFDTAPKEPIASGHMDAGPSLQSETSNKKCCPD